MVKGASGPEDYLPPDETYVCSYLTNWMRIKASWGLQFSSDEASAINQDLKDHSCATAQTRPKLSDIQKNRASSMRMNIRCSLSE
jgi:hypothetical protein